MIKLPRYIQKTLSVRLSLMVVSAMALLLMASLTIMLHFSRKTVKEEALQKASQTLEGTVQHIDNILLSVEQAAGNTYINMTPYLDKPDMITSFSRELVNANPYIIGCAIAFKPYYFHDRENFMAYFHRANSNPNSTESPIIQSETFANCPYTEQIWFTKPMSSGKPGWMNPLVEQESEIEPIITFCLPLRGQDGTMVGVMGVDVSLSLLSHIILSAKPSPNSYSILLADDGSFMVHPDDNMLQHNSIHIAAPTVKAATDAMLSGETGYKPFRMNNTDYYVFYKPFKRTIVPGRSMEALNWSAGIIYPADDIFGDYNLLLYYVLAIAIIGLLLLYVLSRTIIHHQLLPLRLLTKSAQRIAQGNYSEIIPDSHQQDEIGRLQNDFQQMQQSLATHVGELEQLTATLQKHNDDLQIAYEQARQANRMKTTFLHNMTDQMSGPSIIIDKDVELLCDSSHTIDYDEACRLTDEIQKQGKTIAELLNDLLRMAEEETGKEENHD